jgi:hypothetical protein
MAGPGPGPGLWNWVRARPRPQMHQARATRGLSGRGGRPSAVPGGPRCQGAGRGERSGDQGPLSGASTGTPTPGFPGPFLAPQCRLAPFELALGDRLASARRKPGAHIGKLRRNLLA